jgi:uncharacterized delta-60 repeat protein
MIKLNHALQFSLICLFLLFPLMINAAGVLDTTFGINGRAILGGNDSYSASKILVQPDDKIIVASVGIPDGGADSQIIVARFNADGSADVNFGSGGISSVGSKTDLGDVKLQPDGKIVVVGRIEAGTGTNTHDYFAARFNANGSLDQTFGSGGRVIVDRPPPDCRLSSLAVQPDGKLVAVGSCLNPAIYPSDNYELIRFNQNGTMDATFGSNGFFINATFTRFSFVGVTSDGKIIVGGFGHDRTPKGTDNGRVARLTSNGTVDTAFGQNGFVSVFAGLFSMAVQPDDKIVVSGYTFRRLLTNGSYDSFGTALPWRGSVKLLPDGRVLVLSSGGRINLLGKTGVLIGRITLPRENPQEPMVFRDAAVQSNGKIVVSLATNSGVQQPRDRVLLVRYNSITSFANKFPDYDFDDKSDIGIYRPSNRIFYLLNSSAGFRYETAATSVDVVIPENFRTEYSGNPDYASDLVWTRVDQSYNYFCPSNRIRSSIPGGICFQWGLSTDVSVGGDYDGNGESDPAIFRDGLWHIQLSSFFPSLYINWGQAGDKPVPADYDYDGRTDAAIYRPSTGVWWILRSSDSTYTAVQFGVAEDKPVPADYDGDGRADFAVYRPSNGVWYLLKSTEGFAAAQFGVSTDKPVPGDYDGDGLTDIAVFRPSDGNWYLLQSKNGFGVVHWGQSGDIPLSTAYAAQ